MCPRTPQRALCAGVDQQPRELAAPAGALAPLHSPVAGTHEQGPQAAGDWAELHGAPPFSLGLTALKRLTHHEQHQAFLRCGAPPGRPPRHPEAGHPQPGQPAQPSKTHRSRVDLLTPLRPPEPVDSLATTKAASKAHVAGLAAAKVDPVGQPLPASLHLPPTTKPFPIPWRASSSPLLPVCFGPVGEVCLLLLGVMLFCLWWLLFLCWLVGFSCVCWRNAGPGPPAHLLLKTPKPTRIRRPHFYSPNFYSRARTSKLLASLSLP